MSRLQLHPQRRSDPADTLARAARLVDPDSGIIRLVYESPVEPDAPQIFGYGSLLADTSQYGVEDFGLINGSTSMDRQQAAAGAIGEAVERYSCRFMPHGDLVHDSFQSLGTAALDPRALILYDDEQYARRDFPYRPFNEQDTLPWVEGYSLTHDRDLLVPAVSVFMVSVDDHRRPLVQQTTNGLACGASLEEAILSGLQEVLERDASMLTWFSHNSPAHLDLNSSIGPRLQRCIALFEQARLPVDVLDISTDTGVFAVLASAPLGERFGGGLVYSSASNLSPENAVVGAMEELAQCIPWVRVLSRRNESPKSLDRLTLPEDHVLWSTPPAYRHHTAFLTAGSRTTSLPVSDFSTDSDVLASIRQIVSRLSACGLEVIVVDLTPPDISEAGFTVVRVLVPGTLPLYFGSGLWRTGGPNGRLYASNPDIRPNYLPHPFP